MTKNIQSTTTDTRSIRSIALEQAKSPTSQTLVLSDDLPLDCGVSIPNVQIAYETYGTLNEAKSNTVLICHALTGDQYACSPHPVTGKPGWWINLIGKGKPIDTDRFFVICMNVLGSCMGSTGPLSKNPNTDKAYGLDLPILTIADMVRSQERALSQLGIESLFAVVGGSMGGMQVLEWVVQYPQKVFAAIPLATGARHSSQNIAFNEVGRQAVMADPVWNKGRYMDTDTYPAAGLSVARMAAHITYLSEAALQRKFGRNLQDRDQRTYSFDADFQIESYLRHQGTTFVDRFDANSYLYVTRAMDYFDLAASHNGRLADAFMGTKTRFCLVSFSSDWLFPTSESRTIVHALNAAGASVSFVDIETDKGHDAFLLDIPEMFATISGFLGAAAKARGLSES